MAEEKRETIIVNPVSENKETIFPTLGLSKFEKQMKAFNSYSALTKFRNETGISPAFDYNTLGEYTTGNLLDLKNYGTSKFSVDYLGRATVATPTTDYHAATKKYVDDNTGLWEIDGTETQLKTADEIDMRSKKIINLTDPTANQDAATKKYVDGNAYTSPYVSFNVNGSQLFQDDGSPHSVSLPTFNCGFQPSLIVIRGRLHSSDPAIKPPYWMTQNVFTQGIWDGTNYSGTTCYAYNDSLEKTTEGFLTYEGQGASHRYKLEVESSDSDGFTLRVKIEHLGDSGTRVYWRFDIIAYP